MNVEIEAEAALFPEKEYISEIFVSVRKKDKKITNVDIWKRRPATKKHENINWTIKFPRKNPPKIFKHEKFDFFSAFCKPLYWTEKEFLCF